MSKKIWRGKQEDSTHVVALMLPYNTDCTVVPDAACFPVKEAMALRKFTGRVLSNSEWVAQRKAEDKYLRAVERMKKKAVKK